MMMQGTPFPFVVELPSPQQVQMWAWFAGHASTQEAFDIVSKVYDAWWFAVATTRTLSWATEEWQAGDLRGVVEWLDSALRSLHMTHYYWKNALVALEDDPQQFGSWVLCLADAREQVARLSGLVEQVVNHVRVLCAQYGYELPGETQKYLAERVSAQAS